MNKENLLFGIIGLLAGLIISFVATNSYNRSALQGQNTAIPQNMQQAQNSQQPTAASPEVVEAIKKADAETDNFEAQIKAGEMFARIRNFETAIKYFEHANKLKPEDYRAIVTLGNMNFELATPKQEGEAWKTDKLEIAQKWYEQALAKKSDDVNVRTDLGLTYFLREPKDIDRAIQEYQLALKTNPNHEGTLQNLAVAFSEKKDAENLKKVIETLEKINPTNQIVQRLKEGMSQ